MNCRLCLHARQAGNSDLVGCSFWTAILKGDISTMKTAMDYINQEENFGIKLDSPTINREAIGFLIDILIEDYAPKPLYEGWANLNRPNNQNRKDEEMTDSCVVLNPEGCCGFYISQIQESVDIRDVREMAVNG
jgi:hypothetical protein